MKKSKAMKAMLMMALMLSMGLCLVSCSDDEDNEKEQNDDDGNGADSATGMTDPADDQLRDLICQWCDVQHAQLKGTDWKSQTYEPTEGVVTDESQPLVRAIRVGSLEAADRYAVSALLPLGIDSDNPDGFRFSDNTVGTVSYSHSASGNTLATITLDVRQLRLKEIQLVKEWPTNATGNPYYQMGDIIEFEHKLYICVSSHEKNQKAHFVTLNDKATHSKGSFNWRGVGQDIVYNDNMASAAVLAEWLKNIVTNSTTWENVVSRLKNKGYSNEQICQVVPATEGQRFYHLFTLTDAYHLMLDCTKPQAQGDFVRSGAMTAIEHSWQTLHDVEGNPLDADFDVDDEDNIAKLISSPCGYLLANKVRWRVNLFSSWDQWVPYIFLIKKKRWEDDQQTFNAIACESTLSPSHFKWMRVDSCVIDKQLEMKEGDYWKDPVSSGTYYVILLAIYWQHEKVLMMNYYNRILFDFTKDMSESPLLSEAQKAKFWSSNYYWYRGTITSSELTFTDKGKKQSNYTSVSVKNEQ